MKGKVTEILWFAAKSVVYAIGMGALLVYAVLSWAWWQTGEQTAMHLGLGSAESYLYRFRGIISEMPILILAIYTTFIVERIWQNILGILVLCVALMQHYIVNVFYHDPTWDSFWYLVTGTEFIVYSLIILYLKRIFRNISSG
jgi:hypothetical protein